MRSISRIGFLLVLLNFVSAQAQSNDTLAIRQAVLNYIEGFYNADAARMTKAVHPELAKRIIVKDSTGLFMLRNMGSTELLYNTKRNKNTNVRNPDQPFQAEITIYDIYGKIATAKAVTNKFRFIDYVQLGKFEGEWKIVNVLWEYVP